MCTFRLFCSIILLTLQLKISDLSFRRHILVQVLIVMDFLLSLSTKAKEKLANASLPENPNKSVMYADQILSDEDVSSLDLPFNLCLSKF